MNETSPRGAIDGMFPPGDPRGGGVRADGSDVVPVGFGDPQFFQLSVTSATQIPGGRVWTVRGHNFVLQYVRAADSALLRREQRDEMMLVAATPASRVEVAVNGQSAAAEGLAVVNVPAGEVQVRIGAGSDIVLLSTYPGGGIETPINARNYNGAPSRVRPFAYWPGPAVDGIRVHDVGSVARDPKRFGRIYTSSIGMVNVLYEEGARDDEYLSPHVHDDFEQCSVQVAGRYVHHIRTPWSVRLADWRPDHHRLLAAPAVTIIPAGTIHTSQAIDDSHHQLLDIFCPPRDDWAARPGWVLNQADYPLPAHLAQAQHDE